MTVITLTTDFGTRDWFVGAMKGVIARVASDARIVDITHGVAAGDVREGAFALAAAAPFFPAGAIHVAVVDPGVGGARRAIALRTDLPRVGSVSLGRPVAKHCPEPALWYPGRRSRMIVQHEYA